MQKTNNIQQYWHYKNEIEELEFSRLLNKKNLAISKNRISKA